MRRLQPEQERLYLRGSARTSGAVHARLNDSARTTTGFAQRTVLSTGWDSCGGPRNADQRKGNPSAQGRNGANEKPPICGEHGGLAVAKRLQSACGWVACDPIRDGVADVANARQGGSSRRRPLVDPSVVGRCRSCGRRLYGRGKVCRSRRCPEYGPVWAGDQRQKLFRNLETLRGDILLSAVTAPGADELPWDEQACAALGEHKHSGKLGCRVDRVAARAWNESAAQRWRRLHRRAYQETVKRVGKGSVWLVARVWEMQARGVLHVHPVLAYGTARQMAGAKALRGASGRACAALRLWVR